MLHKFQVSPLSYGQTIVGEGFPATKAIQIEKNKNKNQCKSNQFNMKITYLISDIDHFETPFKFWFRSVFQILYIFSNAL